MGKSAGYKFYKLPHLIKTIPHSGKLSRKKSFSNFEVLSVKVFFTKFRGMVFFGGTREQSVKVFSAKVLIPEIFLPY